MKCISGESSIKRNNNRIATWTTYLFIPNRIMVIDEQKNKHVILSLLYVNKALGKIVP